MGASRWSPLLVVLGLSAGLAACGDDPESAAESSREEAGSGETAEATEATQASEGAETDTDEDGLSEEETSSELADRIRSAYEGDFRVRYEFDSSGEVSSLFAPVTLLARDGSRVAQEVEMLGVTVYSIYGGDPDEIVCYDGAGEWECVSVEGGQPADGGVLFDLLYDPAAAELEAIIDGSEHEWRTVDAGAPREALCVHGGEAERGGVDELCFDLELGVPLVLSSPEGGMRAVEVGAPQESDFEPRAEISDTAVPADEADWFDVEIEVTDP